MWRYIHTDELYHYGTKGMRWGVRRYQNKDGSLTPAGKKKYVEQEFGKGYKRLTEDGYKQRLKNDAKIGKQVDKLSKKIFKDKEFRQAQQQLKEYSMRSRESYLKNERKWLDKTDFKKLDLYQFREESARRFHNTEDGKKLREAGQRTKSIIEKKVKSIIGDKEFNRPVAELNQTYSKNITLGETYVGRLMSRANSQIGFSIYKETHRS